MTARQTKRNAAPRIDIKPGDLVLLGGTRASFPSHWVLGTVLWADNRDIVVRRSTQNGQSWIQTAHVLEVRAKGSFEHLYLVQEAARKAVLNLQREATDCEAALGRARDAIWAKLDELAAGGLNIIPPDFEALDAERESVHAACEQADIEEVTP